MGRVYGISHSTVARHLARIGRHCLIFHHNLLQDTTLDEPLVVDGFETFEFSQYFPFHINFAAGSDSWLLYHFTDSPLRRKGSMTPGQKMRRAELEELFGRPDPKAVEKGMAYLLRPLLERVKVGQELVLHSDDHPAYRRALQRLVRHSSANHRRETIAFSKRRQAALERAAIFTVWRNCIKKRSENGPQKSAAMWVGLLDRLLTWKQVLRRRLFPAHADLPREWMDYYWRKVKTVTMGDRQTCHACRYAF
jgi:hypothetical protein